MAGGQFRRVGLEDGKVVGSGSRGRHREVGVGAVGARSEGRGGTVVVGEVAVGVAAGEGEVWSERMGRWLPWVGA